MKSYLEIRTLRCLCCNKDWVTNSVFWEYPDCGKGEFGIARKECVLSEGFLDRRALKLYCPNTGIRIYGSQRGYENYRDLDYSPLVLQEP